MATLESIQAKIAKLQAQAESIFVNQSTAVLDKIRELMDKHSISLADIESHVGKRRGRKPGNNAASPQPAAAAKYRDPKSGALWSGRGRAPAWIANAKDRTRFLIDDQAPTPATKKTAKAGRYVRGVQSALYQDPKSGATWSGRGRAPAWLAGVKDRSKFLIAKAGEPAAKTDVKEKTSKPAPAGKSVAKKAAVAKKVAVKKVAANKELAAARKSASKDGAVTKARVARKVRAPKSAVKSATPVEAVAPQATEVVNAPATA